MRSQLAGGGRLRQYRAVRLGFWFLLLPSLFFVISVAPAKEIVLDTVVVGAEKSDPHLTVITGEELRHKRGRTVADVLRQIPGVDVAASGGPGQPTSVFIRGAKAEHTLVLVDGVEAADASTSTRFFDFANLTIENIDRIEVYRGVKAVQFGADAIGGVVNIISKRGQGPNRSSLAGDVGSYRTTRVSGTTAGSSGAFSYSFGASRFATEGFSAANAVDGDEADGITRTSFSSRLGYDFSSNIKTDFTLRMIDAVAAQDISGGINGDDPNYTAKTRQILSGATVSSRPLKSMFSSAGIFYGSSNRQYDNDPDLKHNQDYHENFRSENFKIETNHRITFDREYLDDSTLELAVQFRQEAGASDQTLNGAVSRLDRRDQSLVGESLVYAASLGKFSFETGLRHDTVSTSGDSLWNGQVSGAIHFDHTIFSAGYGTGFKNPSLFQLYSNFGSRYLKAERAATLDVAVEQKFSSAAQLKVGYFQNRFTNLIDFDIAASRYANIAEARSAGVEVQLTILPADEWTVTFGGKSLATEDGQTGLQLLRRPDRTFSVEAKWKGDTMHAALEWRYTGQRDDIDPTSFSRIPLESYQVAEANFSYFVDDEYEATLKIENVFDTTYQDVAGYRTSRRAAYAGLTANF